LGDIGILENIALQKSDVKMWIAFFCLKIGTTGDSCE
jgi:hypothetical protein